MAVTTEDIKAQITEQAYQMLGGDTAAEKAIERARIWLNAHTRGSTIPYTEDDPVVAQAIAKYALYELYSSAEQEGLAQDKKQDAIELIESISKISIDRTSQAATGAVTQRQKR